MTRKEIRYLLFRIKTELGGGAQAAPPRGFKSKFIKQGVDFAKFAELWDVSIEDPFRIVLRRKTIIEEWHDQIKPKNLPGVEEE